jgi:hypothetical protein
LAFLAGYAVDVFYSFLEGMLQALGGSKSVGGLSASSGGKS